MAAVCVQVSAAVYTGDQYSQCEMTATVILFTCLQVQVHRLMQHYILSDIVLAELTK